MSHRPVRRSACPLALACALVLLLTGCSSETLSALWPEPTPSWTPTPVPGADQRSESSGTPDPSNGAVEDPSGSEGAEDADYFPGVRPANGRSIRMETVTYRLPRALQVRGDTSSETVSAQDEDVSSFLTVNELPVVTGADLSELADAFADGLPAAHRYQRGPDFETAVCTMFSFYGVNPRTGVYHQHASCEVDDRTLVFTASATGEERQQAARQVLFQTLKTLQPR